ncbi:hypothetical protein GF406_08210 [candidate division KSB1 bacterium]|nr:hypothetical protein [candidate division KSB1 bacterium]
MAKAEGAAMNDSRDKILNDIRQARDKAQVSSEAIPEEQESLPGNPDELWPRFEQELVRIAGEFHILEDLGALQALVTGILQQLGTNEFAVGRASLQKALGANDRPRPVLVPETDPVERRTLLDTTKLAVSMASFAIAETGSVAFLYGEKSETLSLFLSECVILLVAEKHIVRDKTEFFRRVRPGTSLVFISGPSRTADIEKVLVLGAHGPSRLVVCCVRNALWEELS